MVLLQHCTALIYWLNPREMRRNMHEGSRVCRKLRPAQHSDPDEANTRIYYSGMSLRAMASK